MAKKQISFASCNLFNLNIPGEGIYGDTDGWDQNVFDKKIEWTGSMLSKMESDVWGFQELWHEQALEDAFRKARLFSKYDLLVPDDHSGKSIVCAGAVRKEILEGAPEWISKFPEKFILMSGGDDAQTSKISVSNISGRRTVITCWKW